MKKTLSLAEFCSLLAKYAFSAKKAIVKIEEQEIPAKRYTYLISFF
jgi:hypothetical protein